MFHMVFTWKYFSLGFSREISFWAVKIKNDIVRHSPTWQNFLFWMSWRFIIFNPLSYITFENSSICTVLIWACFYVNIMLYKTYIHLYSYFKIIRRYSNYGSLINLCNSQFVGVLKFVYFFLFCSQFVFVYTAVQQSMC